MVNNMEEDFIFRKKELKEKVSGKMEKD